jgi:FkbM family methyltransferase
MLKTLLSHKIFRIPYSKFINREYKVNDSHCPMYVDLSDVGGPSSHIVKGTIKSYEPTNIKALAQYLGPDKVMLDIGANIGHYSVQLAREFPKSSFYSFEPHPFSFHLLGKNLNLHGLRNVKTFNLGLAQNKGELVLFHNKRNSGGHSFVSGQSTAEFKPLAKVPVERLDDFITQNKINRVDVIKIDVEGYEYDVFLGAKKLISEKRPVVMFEFSPHLYKKMGYAPDAPLTFFLSQDYVLFDLERQREFSSASELIKAMDRPQTNILAKPR